MRELREAIDAGVTAVVSGEPVPEATREALEGALVAQREELVRAPDGSLALRPVTPDDLATHGLGLLALDAARMFSATEVSRVHVCASETCSARFFDRSPAAVRRWCSSSGCGNVEKARRHRRRRREEQA